MKIEEARCSERMTSFHNITQCQNPEEYEMNFLRSENTKSLIVLPFVLYA